MSEERIEDFRARARAWIAANRPPQPDFQLPQTFLEVATEEQFLYLQAWQRAVYDAGFLGFDVPREYGGQGIDPERHRVVAEELVAAQAPFFVNFLALHWAAPTILAHGSEEQKRELLRPLLRADEIWCQGFSEPNAGSDLASLRTTAVEQADGSFRVDGHKVWTTVAHFAHRMILLARTETGTNKYAGLSYFLFPMRVPGVSVQPLVKMNGEGGFNQVLFDGAVGPANCLLGRRGEGWAIAMTTLTFERGAAEHGGRERTHAFVAQLASLVETARHTERAGYPVTSEGRTRAQLAELWIEGQAIALAAQRAGVPSLNRDRPLALPMMNKLVSSEWSQRVSALACELLGADAGLYLGDARAPAGGEWPRAFMNSFGMTIGGGTSQILRNILAERVLGLPKGK